LSQLKKIFITAIEKRKNALTKFDCLRILDGAGDGAPGIIIEKFGKIAIAHLFEEQGNWEIVDLKELTWSQAKIESVYVRVRTKSKITELETEASLIFGEPVQEIIINEQGLELFIRPERVTNGGLFIDTREVRKFIFENSKDKKVLNTFCYTGSLGLASFVGGAKEVTQIDSNKGILNWARENFELNKKSGFGLVKHIQEDTISFIKKEVKRIAKGTKDPYDIVILDPPTFGRSEKGVFKIEKDLGSLLLASKDLLSEKSILVLTVNNQNFNTRDLKNIIEIELAHTFNKMIEILPSQLEYPTAVNKSSVVRGWICIV